MSVKRGSKEFLFAWRRFFTVLKNSFAQRQGNDTPVYIIQPCSSTYLFMPYVIINTTARALSLCLMFDERKIATLALER